MENGALNSCSGNNEDCQENAGGVSDLDNLLGCFPVAWFIALCALQTGTFDSKEGEFEFIYKSKMHQNRRRFVL